MIAHQPGGDLLKMLTAQTITNAPTEEEAMTLISIPPQHADLRDGHFITSAVELDTDTHAVSCTVKEMCTNKVAGFTGAVQLHYYNENNFRIGASPLQQYEINQAPLGDASQRHETFADTAPPGTNGLALAQFWDPKNRFGEVAYAVGEFFADIGNWVAGAPVTGADFCSVYPDVCVGLAMAICVVVISPTEVTASPLVVTIGVGA